MKKNKLNGIILILITIVLLFFILKDNFLSTLKIISNINILLFLLAIILYIIVFMLEGIVSLKLVKEYKPSYSFVDAFSLSLVLRFFNGITPFSTGGRPLQVYELKKRGVRVIDGINVVVQSFVVFQISVILLSVLLLILNSVLKIYPTTGTLYVLTIIGFLTNVILLFVALLFSINKKLNKTIIRFFVKVGFKLRFIKNKEAKYKKWEKLSMEYYTAFSDFKYKIKLILSSVGVQVLSLLLYYSIIIFVFYSLNIKVDNYLAMILGSNFIFLSGSFVPLPGGSGGIEYAFLSYFSKFASSAELSSALIAWRFATYYLPTLMGGIAFDIINKRESA